MKHPDLISRVGIAFFEKRYREDLFDQPEWSVVWSGIISNSDSWAQSHSEPVHVFGPNGWDYWIYKNFVYCLDEDLDDDSSKLLIIDSFDKERRLFERLRSKYSGVKNAVRREHLSESVRIFVWQRDEGKCVRCDSRLNLEYDHIIPISEGGSNTARNIELLCEVCNRSKSNKIQ